MSEPISVLIVDDNAMWRAGLRDKISDDDGIKVVGEAINGEKALKQYRSLNPDVVTMDYRMPRQNGLEASQTILDEFPDARIIFLSIFEGEEDVWNAWRIGVQAYLFKEEASDQIIEAIHEVAAGNNYFPAAMAQKLEQRKGQRSLTPREKEILQLIVGGRSNKEISDAIGISYGTVRLHVSHLLKKLGAVDRTQAAILAVKSGVVHLK